MNARVEPIELGPEQEFPLGLLHEGQTDPVHTVAELLPDGYATYLRVFHPFLPADPRDPDSTLPGPVRTWRSLADEAGAVFHPEIMWWSLIDALGGEDAEARPYWISDGYLDEPARSALFDLLEDGSEREAYFLYDLAGTMWADGPLLYRASIRQHPRVQIAAVQRLGMDTGPEFVWPLDRTWVLNTDYDLDSTYIACDEAMAKRVLDSPNIEALTVTRAMRVDSGADAVNVAREDADDGAK
jgi:hypothetical protein